MIWERHKRFIQACGVGALLLLLVYIAVVRTSRAKSEEVIKSYKKHDKDWAAFTNGWKIAEARTRISAQNERMTKDLAKLKKQLNLPFGPWVTTLPPGKSWGVYFREMYAGKRETMRTRCSAARVDLLDPNLGFDVEGYIHVAEAPENLKKLAIVEKLMELLMAARVRKIVRVTPQDAEEKGAVVRRHNPQYNPKARRGAGRERFIRIAYPPMLREYPIEIAIVTKLDPLLDFLRSVRREKQVLVIRSLNIRNRDFPGGGRDHEMIQSLAPEELYVTISAAGMSFLSPKAIAEREKRLASTAPRPVRRPTEIRPLGY